MLIKFLREKQGEVTKTEMSSFAMSLHNGELVTSIDDPNYKNKKVKLSYNKRQFYDRILTPMKAMGLIDYDLYKKTYRISDQFNKALVRVGLMWMREFRKTPGQGF